MSNRITLFREEPLNGILGFYIQYNTASTVFWFGEIYTDEDLKRYNRFLGKNTVATRISGKEEFTFRWNIRVREDKAGVRYIPLKTFDRFIMQPFLHPEMEHLRDTILSNVEFNFDYKPVKFIDVY